MYLGPEENIYSKYCLYLLYIMTHSLCSVSQKTGVMNLIDDAYYIGMISIHHLHPDSQANIFNYFILN